MDYTNRRPVSIPAALLKPAVANMLPKRGPAMLIDSHHAYKFHSKPGLSIDSS